MIPPKTPLLLLGAILLLTPSSATPLPDCGAPVSGSRAAAPIGEVPCCRICTTGRACGDGCIPLHRSCVLEPGCACDAAPPPPVPDGGDGPPRDLPQPDSSAHLREETAQTSLLPCTVERIIDGDTFVCEGLGRVRLLLVDAPERSQADAGRMATDALTRLIPTGSRAFLELDLRERDRYGRILAYVYDGEGRMVNEELARLGMVVVAVYPPNVRHVERLREAVAEARDAGRGLWSSSGFTCEPAEHRAGRCP